jgi:hypothetical protein
VTIAILAPVPLEHLEEGRAVCEREGRGAFGSRLWDLFRDVGPGTSVLIYASHTETRTTAPSVIWTASYLKYMESRGGEHPEGIRVRPPSTKADAKRYWAGFYEVADLAPLPENRWVPTGDLRDRDGRSYRRNFVPERPMIITDQSI